MNLDNINKKLNKQNLTIVGITTKEDYQRYGKRWQDATSGYKTVLVCTDADIDGLDSYEGEYNIAEMRNYALNKVSTDWVLMLDMDELPIIFESDFETFDMKGVGAIKIGIISRRETGRDANFYHENLRIHRSNLRYKGHAHETIEQDIEDNGYSVAKGETLILHHGYRKDNSNRFMRNAYLLAKDIVTDPKNMNAYKNMHRTLLGAFND